MPCGGTRQCFVNSKNPLFKITEKNRRGNRERLTRHREALWAAVSRRAFLVVGCWHPSICNSSYLHHHPLHGQSVHQLATESLRRREPSKDSEALNTLPITRANHFLDPLTTGAFLESTDDDVACCRLNGFLSTVCALTSLCSIACDKWAALPPTRGVPGQSVGCD